MILVFGDGLLGTHLCAKYRTDTILVSHKECDITDARQVENTILRIRPDVVVNAAGLVRNRGSVMHYLEVNAFAPFTIAEVCDRINCKMVQISTDCVFSGNRGFYTEQDEPDEVHDVYGWSKAQGEIYFAPHLTIRTSFIGLPDPKGRSLLGWLVRHPPGSVVPGYTNLLWNGLSTLVLSDCIVDLAYSHHSGIVHVFGQVVSKYDVLRTVVQEFRLPYEIQPMELLDPPNRTLRSIRAEIDCLPRPPSLREMVQEMYKWQPEIETYLKLRL